MEGNHRVTVGLRIRPPSCADPGFSTTIDQVFTQHTNLEVYNALVSPCLSKLEYSTIFTYGRTGSGKTYTMFGDGSGPGIVELLLKDVLVSHQMVSIRCIEVYNEAVTDLLTDGEVRIIQENGRTRIVGAPATIVATETAVKDLLERIAQKRKTYQTEHNSASSRSHTVIEVSAIDLLINLVDLAGNEKVSQIAERRQEGLLINKSLLTLGKVIDQLHNDSAHVSFRESKLTRLLQNTLGGGTIICICTVLTTLDLPTIKFGERLKRIKGALSRQQKSPEEVIRDLQQKIAYLTGELSALRAPSAADESILYVSTADRNNTLPVPFDRGRSSGTTSVSVLEESLVAVPTANHIVEEIRGIPAELNPKADLYEMIYLYFRKGESHLANTLDPADINKVKITVTKKKKGKSYRGSFKTVFKESRTHIKPYNSDVE
ncbi:hypothetical protein NEDG_00938 [Nematocida displodere]|uniref:Kinesin motor domain-containing protein n=1 Tax=Nematocida displodere TaxID=1805483 RepID=A0A177ECS7_9MICR|nr:hypothetical protein NEDG_00938 [Nematocida displodere]